MSLMYITPHFNWLEFQCHDGTDVPDALKPTVRRLCETVLEPLRARWMAPLTVVSGYRTPHYNEVMRHAGHGMALHSRHMTGEAADIAPVELGSLPRLTALVETMLRNGELPTLGGFGIYPRFVHLDIREKHPAGHLARWIGAGVASEQ